MYCAISLRRGKALAFDENSTNFNKNISPLPHPFKPASSHLAGVLLFASIRRFP